jgi:hypothetical protein
MTNNMLDRTSGLPGTFACYVILLCVFISGCATVMFDPTDANTASMTDAKAHMVLASLVQKACLPGFDSSAVIITWMPAPTLRFRTSDPVDSKMSVHFSDIADIYAESMSDESTPSCNTSAGNRVRIDSTTPIFAEWYADNDIFIYFQTQYDADQFVAAVYRINHPIPGSAQMPDMCISNPVRGLQSPDVETEAVQAAAAIRRKDYLHAINLYQQIQQTAPCWPRGYYNSAVILAQNGDYTDAINDMRIYVQLVPAASDAQRANQQIAIWQDQVQESQAATQ